MSAPEAERVVADPTATWAVPVSIGYRIAGWEVVEPIASGNYGSVYAARRVAGDGDRTDALKFLATGSGSPRQSRHTRELAEREASFSRQAPHERLIAISDTLVVDDPEVEFDGAVVLVMQRATCSLQDLIDRSPTGRPVPGAAQLVMEICEGLQHLHGAGWVHGDLKPSNILIMEDGSVRLADFGLVSRLEGTHGYGAPLGSTDYLPPERLQDGLDERGVQVRTTTDVWALGVTVHQLLTGGLWPVSGATPGARAAAAQEFATGRESLRLPNDLDPPWREFIELCLAPDHRTRSAVDIGDLLERARRLVDPRAVPSAAKPGGGGALGGRRTWRWIAGAASAVVVAGTVGVWWWAGPGRTADPSARIHVHNAETPCQHVRSYSCSMGLAMDPRREYAAGNVSTQRVWHGDVLSADCMIFDGTRVADEYGVGSTRWFRVAVPDGRAWLPGVRTMDNPEDLPTCTG